MTVQAKQTAADELAANVDKLDIKGAPAIPVNGDRQEDGQDNEDEDDDDEDDKQEGGDGENGGLSRHLRLLYRVALIFGTSLSDAKKKKKKKKRWFCDFKAST